MNNAQNKRLGKGLSALMSDEYSHTIDDTTPMEGAHSQTINISELVSGKFQPRHRFTEKYLQELAESIRKNGIMQPIIVRKSAESLDKYEIIAGERRWRAAQIAGLSEVPIIIRKIDDQQALELALVENIQRQDLTPLEEGAGYQRLIDEFSYTQEELAVTVGKSRSHVANLLRLLSLPESIKAYLDTEQLTMGHARALLKAPDPEALADQVVKRGLNVRQTENLCRVTMPNAGNNNNAKKKVSFNASERVKDPDILALEETLSESLGLRVSIDDDGQSGNIVITYESLSQLDEVLQRLSS
jgi:ParB family chromosome partitioning protein